MSEGLLTQYDNPNLRFYCNEFKNNDWAVDFNYLTKGSIADQSSTCADMRNPNIALDDKIIPNNTFLETLNSPCLNLVGGGGGGHLWAYSNSWTTIADEVFYRDNPTTPNLPNQTSCIELADVDYDVCPVNSNNPQYNCTVGIQPIVTSSGNGGGSAMGSAVLQEATLISAVNNTNTPMLKQHRENKLLRFYLQNDKEQSAIAILDAKNTTEATLQTVSAYIKRNEHSMAQIKLATIPQTRATTKLHTLFGTLISLSASNTALADMSAIDEATIRLIAADNTPGIGEQNIALCAQGILDRAFGEFYPRYMPKRDANAILPSAAARGTNTDDETSSPLERTEVRLSIAPNPTNNSTTISITTPDVISTEGRNLPYTVQIFDIRGVLVKYKTLMGNESFELQKREIGNGIFYSILRNEEEIIDRQKIIILK